MPVDLLLPALHLALPIAVGALTHRRLAVLFCASVAAAHGVLVTGPAALAAMELPDLALAVGGLVPGTLVGGWLAGRRARRTAAERAARDAAAGRSAPRRRRAPVGALSWLLGASTFAIAAATALYVEGGTVPEVRTTVDGWLDTPTARAMGLGTPRTPAGTATGGSAARASGTAATRAAASPADGATPARAAPRAERPQGDLRHCLGQPSGSDVIRCAEGAR